MTNRPGPTAMEGIERLLREQGQPQSKLAEGLAKQPKKKGKYGAQHKAGEMNQTERAYSEWLEARKLAGEVQRWYFETITFTLYYHPTDATRHMRFTVDFTVVLADGTIEMIDVKGGGPVQDDSIVKIKMAADKYPCFKFVQEKKSGKGWKRTEF